MNQKDIEFTIEEGHKIANALRECNNLEECEDLHDAISEYMKFVRGEKDSELATCLGVAYAWRKTTFDQKYINNEDTKRLFEHFLEQFEDYLNSGRWAKGESAAGGD